jgi:hypothetical protein
MSEHTCESNYVPTRRRAKVARTSKGYSIEVTIDGNQSEEETLNALASLLEELEAKYPATVKELKT